MAAWQAKRGTNGKVPLSLISLTFIASAHILVSWLDAVEKDTDVQHLTYQSSYLVPQLAPRRTCS